MLRDLFGQIGVEIVVGNWHVTGYMFLVLAQSLDLGNPIPWLMVAHECLQPH